MRRRRVLISVKSARISRQRPQQPPPAETLEPGVERMVRFPGQVLADRARHKRDPAVAEPASQRPDQLRRRSQDHALKPAPSHQFHGAARDSGDEGLLGGAQIILPSDGVPKAPVSTSRSTNRARPPSASTKSSPLRMTTSPPPGFDRP